MGHLNINATCSELCLVNSEVLMSVKVSTDLGCFTMTLGHFQFHICIQFDSLEMGRHFGRVLPPTEPVGKSNPY